jgi:alanine dehydrogenase
MLYLDRQQVRELLTYDECIAACEEALVLQAKGETEEHPRFHLSRDLRPGEVRRGLGPGSPHFMVAYVKTLGITTMRTLNPTPMLILWDERDIRMLIDAQKLRDIRTGSVAAVASKYLARKDSHKFGVIGSGNQATNSLAAHSRLFDISECKVYSPTPEHREKFVERFREAGLNVTGVDSAEEAASDVDILVSCSGVTGPNRQPVLHGEWLAPGTHVSSIAGRSELADSVIERAGRIVIDAKATFPEESWDITVQAQKGLITWDQVDELQNVVAGISPGRQTNDEITLLKTVGTATQDTLPAWRLYQLATERGVGDELGNIFPPLSAAWD